MSRCRKQKWLRINNAGVHWKSGGEGWAFLRKGLRRLEKSSSTNTSATGIWGRFLKVGAGRYVPCAGRFGGTCTGG